VIAATATAGVLAVLSLGPELVVNQHRTGIDLPYQVLLDRPVIDAALPQRYALPVVPLLAIVLVLALDRARTRAGRGRLVVPAAIGLALLPLIPTPLPTGDRPPVPAFIADGHWRYCAEPGGVLVPVPLPTARDPEPMRWAAAANAGFGLPEGFFIGPYARGGNASVGTFKQPTSRLLAEVADTGEIPPIRPADRSQAAEDLAFWGADCVVLRPDQRYGEALHSALEELLGPADRVAGVWVWRVSPPAE